MTTDWLLIRRAAAELDRALRNGRVLDAGMLDDGRFGVRIGALRGRGDTVLAVDTFGSPPLVMLAQAELAIGGDPGWAKAAATALRGMRVLGVRSRRGDRVIVVTFGTTSRFGVGDEAKLVLELIPRYGNVLVLRDRTIIAAAKQFSPAENEARSVQAGQTYEPPPLPAAKIDAAAFVVALAGDHGAKVKALGAFRPEVPRLIAESFVSEAETIVWPSAARLGAWLTDRADSLDATTQGEPESFGPLHTYRGGDRLIAAHVLALHQYASLTHATVDRLLPLFDEARTGADRGRSASALERRRATLLGRIAKRASAIVADRAALGVRMDDVAGRERLRTFGDALHTYGPLVAAGATEFTTPEDPPLTIPLDAELDAKANAARYFFQYRKAADALPHLASRAEMLAEKAATLDELAFEAERADSATTISELATALDELDGKKRTTARATPAKRAREPLRIERPSGARIFVGRNPRENVDVTFRIARPDDLWFHARNIPGSHVVLQAPPGGAADEADIDAAANLAATNSRAKSSPRVDVDYTERKYVRKQRDAAPGRVWYTNARTRVGRTLRADEIGDFGAYVE